MTYQPAFFEISAQLIPVLFLAMVVEDKLQPEEGEAAWERVVRTWVAVLLFGSEALCLTVVAGGVAPTSGVGRSVALAALFAGFLLVVAVVGREITAGRARNEQIGHALAGLTLIGGVFGLALKLGF